MVYAVTLNGRGRTLINKDKEPGDSNSLDTNPCANKSDDPERDSDLVFYYSREQHQKRTSAADLEKNANKKPGLIKSLTGGRGNFFLLISIVLICIMYFLGIRISNSRTNTAFNLGGNTVALSVLEEETILFLSIKKTTPSRGNAYIGSVDVSVSPALSIEDGELSFINQRISFSGNKQEVFRLSLPFDSEELILIFRTENEAITRTIKSKP